MKNFKRIENNLDSTKIKIMDDFKHLSLSTCIIEKEQPFDILVKNGENIKINQPIFINKDGQKILSCVSGKVLGIKLKEENKNILTYYLELENDFKNKKIETKIKNIKNKKELINSIKEFGITNKNFLIYKEIEKTNKVLFLDCYDDVFVYNNFAMLTNFFKEIEYAIKKLKQLLQIEKILFFTSKNNSNFVKKIKKDCDKIYFKKCKHNAINMFDLYKIYLLLKNEILNYDILSVTGRALKENNVVFIKSGANFQDIIEKFGGLIQNIEEIENFKYTAMLAYNDEITLKDKIKKCKNTIDKQKLIKMLETKKIEAKTNIYDKLNDYHQKYLNCLSACFVSKKNEKINIKDFNLPIKCEYLGVHLLNNKYFH